LLSLYVYTFICTKVTNIIFCGIPRYSRTVPERLCAILVSE
jgi:hypothetical protein